MRFALHLRCFLYTGLFCFHLHIAHSIVWEPSRISTPLSSVATDDSHTTTASRLPISEYSTPTSFTLEYSIVEHEAANLTTDHSTDDENSTRRLQDSGLREIWSTLTWSPTSQQHDSSVNTQKINESIQNSTFDFSVKDLPKSGFTGSLSNDHNVQLEHFKHSLNTTHSALVSAHLHSDRLTTQIPPINRNISSITSDMRIRNILSNFDVSPFTDHTITDNYLHNYTSLLESASFSSPSYLANSTFDNFSTVTDRSSNTNITFTRKLFSPDPRQTNIIRHSQHMLNKILPRTKTTPEITLDDAPTNRIPNAVSSSRISAEGRNLLSRRTRSTHTRTRHSRPGTTPVAVSSGTGPTPQAHTAQSRYTSVVTPLDDRQTDMLSVTSPVAVSAASTPSAHVTTARASTNVSTAVTASTARPDITHVSSESIGAVSADISISSTAAVDSSHHSSTVTSFIHSSPTDPTVIPDTMTSEIIAQSAPVTSDNLTQSANMTSEDNENFLFIMLDNSTQFADMSEINKQSDVVASDNFMDSTGMMLDVREQFVSATSEPTTTLTVTADRARDVTRISAIENVTPAANITNGSLLLSPKLDCTSDPTTSISPINNFLWVLLSIIALFLLCLLLIIFLIVHRRNSRKLCTQRGHADTDLTTSKSACHPHLPMDCLSRPHPPCGCLNPGLDVSDTYSRVVSTAALAETLANTSALKDEFRQLPMEQMPTQDEMPSHTETKNRYANVLPLPESRVYLEHVAGVVGSSYINANYISSYDGQSCFYIATQAPLAATITDFWRMVWENNCCAIVCLTELVERGVKRCAEYLPPSDALDRHRKYGAYDVTLMERASRVNYVKSRIELKCDACPDVTRQLTHFWYTEWGDRGPGSPLDTKSLVDMLLELKIISCDSEHISPIVVHCSPGTSRTGVIICADMCMRQMDRLHSVDVMNAVYRLRRERAGCIQAFEHYQLIYKILDRYNRPHSESSQ